VAISRKGRRRKHTAPLTKSTLQLTKELRQQDEEDAVEEKFDLPERPQIRKDCEEGPRPCPWVGCRHHLYLDVNPENGSIKFNFPDLAPWELPWSCSLDLAEDRATLDETGEYMNLSRERIRQVEVLVLRKLWPLVKRLLDNHAGEDGGGDGLSDG
jgi:hypothetical protein